MKYLVLFLISVISISSVAERMLLDDGSYVDENGVIYQNKYENTHLNAPWNDPLKRDDLFAPWNNTLQKDSIFAPWNRPLSDKQDTNIYMREKDVRDSDYYWD